MRAPPFVTVKQGSHMITLPLSEVLNMQRVCYQTMLNAFAGDPVARADIEQVFAVALDHSQDDTTRGQATISCFLLVDACDQIAPMHGVKKSTMQEQQRRQSYTNTQGVEVTEVPIAVGCNHPSDVPCEKCGVPVNA